MNGKIKKILILPLILGILIQAVHSYASFTIEDEKKLGKEFYEKLKKNNVLLKNKKVNDYISKLGDKILKQTRKAPFDFRFSVIKSPAINAFATPGGYVYVNRGLINLVENESQLAGVLAHEIAHVNARHIADTIEKSKKVVGISTVWHTSERDGLWYVYSVYQPILLGNHYKVQKVD